MLITGFSKRKRRHSITSGMLVRGKLEGFQSCSCGYDCRIIFSIDTEEIVLIDIGNHDEVY
ncbi:MAG: type II toxin-antitoxin system YafQ family toxin [Pseudanabaena sp.]